MLKMRANFIGLHSYNFNELTNWIGPASAVLPNGSVAGAVPGASFATAGGGTHFVGPKTTPFPTSSYYFGAAALFDTDCFCGNAEVVHGDACPIAATSEFAARAFDRAGAFQAEVFKLARSLGIHTATGVELPVVPVAAWPNATSAGVFEGILTRLVNLQTPSEYFWLWTSESWEWCENSPFSQFPYGKKPIIYQDRVGTELQIWLLFLRGQVNVTDPKVAEGLREFEALAAANRKLGSPFKLATGQHPPRAFDR
jgi:hypothetical protein